MAYHVEFAFDQFYEAINLSGDHREIANTRKEEILKILEKNFSVIEAFSTGSIPKFTAIQNHADLDLMIALHYDKHINGKSPKEVLQDIRDVLAEYRTNVRKNGQAVTLYYKTWPCVDIVPVSRAVDDQGAIIHYNVPDMNSGLWIQSKPKTHAINIESHASKYGANFRRIIKMIKHWNIHHGNYLQSYHIEVLALHIFTYKLDDIAWSIFKFFEQAKLLLETKLWHDVGFADDYLLDSDRQEILKRLDAASSNSAAAWFYTFDDNHKKAIILWKQIFGDKFPTYG